MTYEPKSIADHIDCLARLTGAPPSFVDQVRGLFDRKGISLETDAQPYLKALEDAFRREETIRVSTHRAKQNITSVQQNFQKIGKAYVSQLSQLKKVQTTLRKKSDRIKQRYNRVRFGKTQVTIRGDHRTYVTPTVNEELPMVPGPQEVQ